MEKLVSVKPGINDHFVNEEATSFLEKFEVESREIFVHYKEIAKEINLKEGMNIADVGAGTGLFMEEFERIVK